MSPLETRQSRMQEDRRTTGGVSVRGKSGCRVVVLGEEAVLPSSPCFRCGARGLCDHRSAV